MRTRRDKQPINADVPRQRRNEKNNRSRSRGGKAGSAPPRGRGNYEYLKPQDQAGLRHETQAQTNLKFRPLERAVGNEYRASVQRQHEEGDWWQNYLNTVNQGQADTTAAYQQAGSEIGSQMAQASQIDAANTARLQQEAGDSAALRGTTVDPALANREVAAQAQRNYLSNVTRAGLAREGAVQRGYLNEAKRIGVGQSIASRKEEQRRQRSILKDRRDVRKERGEYATAKRGELRDKEREYLIQRKAFGLDKKKAKLEAAEGQRDAREKAADRAYERSQDSISNRQAQERIGISRQSNKPGKNGLTPSEQRDAQEGRQGAVKAAWSLYRAAKKPPKSAQEWAAFESLLRAESEITPTEAAYAVKKLRARVGSAPVQGNRGLPGSTEVPYAP